jgi:hypothetical protein
LLERINKCEFVIKLAIVTKKIVVIVFFTLLSLYNLLYSIYRLREKPEENRNKMTKEEIKKAIREEFPGKTNAALRKHMYATVDGDGSIALTARLLGLGAISKASIDRIVNVQNEMFDSRD